ncbi:hypothetical protein SLA2020_026660 [Shorea laevis]
MKGLSISLKPFFEFLKEMIGKARFKEMKREAKSVPRRQPSPIPEELCRQFSLAELKAATNGFHEDQILAEGTFGTVYKGIISDGSHGSLDVALKRFNKFKSFHSGVEEFRTELELLCQLRHSNIVSLVGFCYEKDDEKDETILVYEYMSYGSLLDYIQCMPVHMLPWKLRLKICIEATRGLHYLHTGAKYAIIHRDFKSASILLGENWATKISHLELSKIGPLSTAKPKASTKMESRIEGTIIYMAPEYARHGELSEKCDVFSLGVILFEVLWGRLAYDRYGFFQGRNLVVWSHKCIKAGNVYDIIDPYLRGKISPDCLVKFVEIAYGCLHPKASERPSVGEVELTLELALELQQKADSVVKYVNTHDGYAYQEVPLHLSARDHDEYLYMLDDIDSLVKEKTGPRHYNWATSHSIIGNGKDCSGTKST